RVCADIVPLHDDAAAVDADAGAAVGRDQVARRRRRAADGDVRAVEDLNAVAAIAERRRARRVRADAVALHRTARSIRQRDAMIVAARAIAADDVARAGYGAADGHVRAAIDKHAALVGHGCRARRVRADVIALNGV